MIVLGKSNDEVGTQLERLTKGILSRLGYQDIVINLIGAGGQEIDISANVRLPLPGEIQLKRVICECKAHREPVAMSDWLKFLGKVYAEEKRLQCEVAGVFVALSGVNGNVAGSYDELKVHRAGIQLLAGDAILHASEWLKCRSASDVARQVPRYTDRALLNIEAAYFEERVYWVVGFSNDSFSVLDGNGGFLSQDDQALVVQMLASRLAAHRYLEFRSEALAKERATLLEKSLIGCLFEAGGSAKRVEIHLDGGTADELSATIDTLADKRLIKAEGDEATIHFATSQKGFDDFAAILRFLVTGKLPFDILNQVVGSSLYDTCIGPELLSYISENQGGLKFSPDKHDVILRLLLLSPSALLYALSPDPMIVTHRKHQPEVGNRAEWDQQDQKTFIRGLCERFSKDFKNPGLVRYFYDKRRLRECDTEQVVRIKSKERLEVQETIRDRTMLAEFSDQLGGGYGYVQAIDHAPEPWTLPPPAGEGS